MVYKLPHNILMLIVAGVLAMNLFKSVEICGYSYLVAGGDNSVVVKKKDSGNAALDNGLPQRLITIFGLERSGTSLIFHTLGKALNLTRVRGEEYTNHPENTIRIQHLSLPFGEFSEETTGTTTTTQNYHKRFETLPILPVKMLSRCMPKTTDSNSSSSSSSSNSVNPILMADNCKAFANVLPPSSPRYFVNVTSHLQWYEQRGVDVQAVVVVRDPTLHFQSISQKCENETAAYEQYQQGVALMQHAMEHHTKTTTTTTTTTTNPLVVVSYETLMTLRGRYLFDIYESLGIQSTFIPPIRNGNAKYVQSIPKSMSETLIEEI